MAAFSEEAKSMYAFGNRGGTKPAKRLFTFPFSLPAEFLAYCRFDEAINSLPCVRCGSTSKVEAYRIPLLLKTPPRWSIPLCSACLREIAGRDLKSALLWFQRQGIDAMVVATGLYDVWSEPNRETAHRGSASNRTAG
jgi:hypothetical protein